MWVLQRQIAVPSAGGKGVIPSTEVEPHPQQWSWVSVGSSRNVSQEQTQHSATEGKTSANLALHFFNISYDVLQVTLFLFVWVLFFHTRLKAGPFPDPSGAYQVKFHPCQDVTAP